MRLVFAISCLTVISTCSLAEGPDDSSLVFVGDWGVRSPSGVPGGWQHEQVWAADRITPMQVETAAGMRHIGLIRVLPGDKVGGWSGTRAELSGMQEGEAHALPVNMMSGHEYYGVSVKIPVDWQAPVATSENPYPWHFPAAAWP